MYKYLIFFYFFFTALVQAETIQNLEVTGNKRISAETIKVYGDITLNKDYSKTDLNNILKSLYETNFFENVTVQIVNGTLKIVVKEYQIINQIEIKGEETKKIKEKIFDLIQLKDKSSFRKSVLTQDIDIIKRVYGALGFNFVEVETKIEKFSDDRVNLIFFVEKGKKTGISKIYFIGDKKIKDKRLRDIIVSEETKFWKFLSKNVNLNSSNIELDKRLLKNYYKSIGYYDIKISSSSAEMDEAGNIEITYSIDAGNRYIIKKIITNADTVFDKDNSEKDLDMRNGYVFKNDDIFGVESALSRAITCFSTEPKDFHSLIVTAMQTDNSWSKSGQSYIDIYKQISSE